MKIHEIINGLYELQYEHGIKFREIRFENYNDISYLAITIKKGDKIMKHVFSSDCFERLEDTDNDYLDFAFDLMVEEIKGEKNDGERKNNC